MCLSSHKASMFEKESAPMAHIFQYSGHSDDEHEYSDQEPWELDEEEGECVGGIFQQTN